MKQLPLLTISLFALFLAACSADTNKVLTLAQLQQQWQLLAIDEQPVDASIVSTLHVDVNGKATGNLACNSFFGTLELQDNSARIAPIGSSRKICLDLQNTIEQQVMGVFANWSKVQLKADTLTFLGKEHQLTYKLK